MELTFRRQAGTLAARRGGRRDAGPSAAAGPDRPAGPRPAWEISDMSLELHRPKRHERFDRCRLACGGWTGGLQLHREEHRVGTDMIAPPGRDVSEHEVENRRLARSVPKAPVRAGPLLACVVCLTSWGCSGNSAPEPDLSIDQLAEEMLRIATVLQESHPEVPAIEVGDLLESVLENGGCLDVINGEKWKDAKTRLRGEGKEFLIPVVEAFAKKCRDSTELRRDGNKPVTEEEKERLIRKYMAPFLKPEIETNEAIAYRSLGDLRRDWNLNIPPEQRFTTEIRAATPTSGYYGYWFVDCGRGGFMAIPCEYGKSGIHTYILMTGSPAFYRKDLHGRVLSRLPEDPEKEGWIEVGTDGLPEVS